MNAAPILSIITAAAGDARLTAKSIAVQQDPCAFEWIVTDAAELANELATLRVPSVNDAMAAARGEYLWFVPGGACLSDAFAMRRLRTALRDEGHPDLLLCDVRDHGRVQAPRTRFGLAWGLPIALPGLVFKRRIAGDLRFVEDDTYRFLVQFLQRADTQSYAGQFFCDTESPPLPRAARVAQEQRNFATRAEWLGMRLIWNQMILKLRTMSPLL